MDSEQNHVKKGFSEYEKHIDKCLSLILHHEEVQRIAEIIKRIYSENNES